MVCVIFWLKVFAILRAEAGWVPQLEPKLQVARMVAGEVMALTKPSHQGSNGDVCREFLHGRCSRGSWMPLRAWPKRHGMVTVNSWIFVWSHLNSRAKKVELLETIGNWEDGWQQYVDPMHGMCASGSDLCSGACALSFWLSMFFDWTRYWILLRPLSLCIAAWSHILCHLT